MSFSVGLKDVLIGWPRSADGESTDHHLPRCFDSGPIGTEPVPAPMASFLRASAPTPIEARRSRSWRHPPAFNRSRRPSARRLHLVEWARRHPGSLTGSVSIRGLR